VSQAVGFHYASSWMHKAEMALGLETDPADVVNEIFRTLFLNVSTHISSNGIHGNAHPTQFAANEGVD
jgi:hypothetical protein